MFERVYGRITYFFSTSKLLSRYENNYGARISLLMDRLTMYLTGLSSRLGV
jgi:hypothetical protein